MGWTRNYYNYLNIRSINAKKATLCWEVDLKRRERYIKLKMNLGTTMSIINTHNNFEQFPH